MKKHTKQVKTFLLVYAAFNLIFASVAYAGPKNFPMIATVDDEDIVENYTPYVHFVAEVGRTIDASKTTQFSKLFEQLKKSDPQQTAQFLKGLRMELIHGAEIAGVSLKTLKSSSPLVRRVVARSLGNWVSELDECLFRYSSQGVAKSGE